MEKIDKRRHYILVLDTETANTIMNPDGSMDMSSVLVYDCGWQIVDTHGNVYSKSSYHKPSGKRISPAKLLLKILLHAEGVTENLSSNCDA